MAFVCCTVEPIGTVSSRLSLSIAACVERVDHALTFVSEVLYHSLWKRAALVAVLLLCVGEQDNMDLVQ
jgi:hypothetical protein